ncbi:uncharacterized protein LOC136035656 [Artemia franciscana]|uniref:uncharacterized protein LOC136035656 n=1 Tax=Artemia franciscana TaxID=6661 RepID=UPI0032D9C73B
MNPRRGNICLDNPLLTQSLDQEEFVSSKLIEFLSSRPSDYIKANSIWTLMVLQGIAPINGEQLVKKGIQFPRRGNICFPPPPPAFTKLEEEFRTLWLDQGNLGI